MAKQPSLFLPHGAPDLLLTEHPAKRFLAELGGRVGRPEAILVVSAHWESPRLALTSAAAPETVHDFYGFPRELYDFRYPAKTDAAVSRRTIELLADLGYAVEADAGRGFDHGAWVPLLLAFPGADIPVIQLSLLKGGTARQHFEIGEALAPLRDEGILIVGSGSVTHNLRALGPEGAPPPDWATGFDDFVSMAVEVGDWKSLMRFPDAPESARRSHPTPEHFLPFFVAAGAGKADCGARLHRSFSHSSISMSAYSFGSDRLAI
ncbi:DODA-type extradiol aromatic ring-opening family dioxygenase [Nisaea sediminum]|uniref:DODA-type extradiol aromatic ring-opening family dioxygenase n=1 Tax=Nisaea sediminum TaxID=2775867 RepID=UPI001868F17E|nr:class III extradiol ring-cleavage dioxygenase [Nisaea sediminum]